MTWTAHQPVGVRGVAWTDGNAELEVSIQDQRGGSERDVSIAGTWVVDETDRRALADLGDVLLKFGADGSLTYVIRSGDRQQIIKLRYQVDGSTIVTDQPSAPRIERTAFTLSEGGVLTLAFEGMDYRFRRRRPSDIGPERETAGTFHFLRKVLSPIDRLFSRDGV